MRSARPGRRTALLHSHYHNAMPRPVIIMTPLLSSPLLSFVAKRAWLGYYSGSDVIQKSIEISVEEFLSPAP